jgi:hypothetical protein
MLKVSIALPAACLCLLAACESESHGSKAAVDNFESKVDAGAVIVPSEPLVMRTDEFSVEAGEERYLCFTKTLDEDVVIDGYSHGAQSFVHHIIFVRNLAPEPEGFSECDTLYRPTWDPLFVAGAGNATLTFPNDAGRKLSKGTQLLMQMHLLNATDHSATATVAVEMHRSQAQDPRPVSTYVFGTMDVHVPANQDSALQADCAMQEPVHLIAAFPHMHLLGTRMGFEGGSSLDTMQPLFDRQPYSFDDQHIDSTDIQLQAGDMTRVTCSYENPDSNEVTFGESTHSEMCFLLGFAIDREGPGACLSARGTHPAVDGGSP